MLYQLSNSREVTLSITIDFCKVKGIEPLLSPSTFKNKKMRTLKQSVAFYYVYEVTLILTTSYYFNFLDGIRGLLSVETSSIISSVPNRIVPIRAYRNTMMKGKEIFQS